MIRNYIKIAWRNLVKNPFYSLINIIGLSIGITFSLLIGAYVFGELTVNHQLGNANDQYILQSKWKDPNMGLQVTTVGPLAKTLREQYPNLVANYYRWDGIESNVSKGDKNFREKIQIGDSTLLHMYGFKLLNGNAKTAFDNPFSVVITKAKAIKYFGSINAIGQTITIQNFKGEQHGFIVSGVLEKPGQNTVLNFDEHNNNEFFLSTAAAKYFGRDLENWANNYIIGYVQLQKGVTPTDLNGPISKILKDNAPLQTSQNLQPYLDPLVNYHLSSNNGVVKRMVLTLSGIALFILLMAIINFINLCVSRSSTRMKEIGIRKVLGGLRKYLIWQFLIESTLLVMLSTIISCVLYALLRPYFSEILGKDIINMGDYPIQFTIIALVLTLTIGLLSGFYPALVLSALKSIDSLKGKLGSVKDHVFLRKSLIIFQFSTAIIVFVGSLIISQQINLFFSKDLGYNKDFLIYAALPRDWSAKGVQKMETIRYELSNLKEVSHVSLSYEIPNGNNGSALQVYKQGSNPAQAISSQQLTTDNEFAATYGIKLMAGNFFKATYTPADSSKVVINETQAKALGWNNPGDAVGQNILIQGLAAPLSICGVIHDFHFGAMDQRIQPATFLNVNYNTNYRYFTIRIKDGNIEKSLSAIAGQWEKLLPGTPFEYKFMDEAIAGMYKTEIQLRKASYVGTAISSLIVLLGILGLVSLSIQKRIKEIGIRKVLGASVPAVVRLFVNEFVILVLVAAVIASPVAYLLMQKWLNNYAYKIAITVNPFAITITAFIVLTALVISVQAIKAALSNPIKSLKTE